MEGGRLLVIGLDGFSPELLRALINEGHMPNLASLLEDGFFCKLRSTLPPNSCPAWLCMATGRNPGKIGVFDILYKDGYSVRPVSSEMLKAEPIWTTLSKAGFKVGVVNVPGTYPPGGVRGFMVSGMLTPSSRECLYPRRLKVVLRGLLKRYCIDLIPWGYFDELSLIRDAISVSRGRAELAIRLSRLLGPDFLFVVFTTPDRLLHLLWNYIDPSRDDPRDSRERAIKEALGRYWRELDAMVQALIDAFKPGLTLVVSDHGFGPKEGTFFVNECLRASGLLDLKRELRTHVIGSMSRLLVALYNALGEAGVLQALYSAAASALGFRRLWDYAHRYLILDKSLRHVDWSATYAFGCAHTPSFGHVYVNLAGREPSGVVSPSRYEEVREAIVGCLLDAGEEHGLRVHVYKREEAYSGPFVHLAPDVVFEPDGYSYEVSPSVGHSSPIGTYWADLRSPGMHKPHGIFLAHGPDLASRNGPSEANIYDVMPTILAYYGLPVPDDVDGGVIKGVLS